MDAYSPEALGVFRVSSRVLLRLSVYILFVFECELSTGTIRSGAEIAFTNILILTFFG
jgi:hypothetical protein